MTPKISIIIAHVNEGYMLNLTLDSIYNYVKYDNYEIIIVDDGSDNIHDLDFVKNHFLVEKIKVYYKSGLGVANARNFGAKQSSGEILFFLDSHMYFYEDSLTILQKDFINSDFDLIQPIITSLTQKDLNGTYYHIASKLLDSTWGYYPDETTLGLYETPNIAGGATLIKRSVFFSLDGFCKYFIKWGVEDLDLSTRAWLSGFKCGLSINTRVAHYFKDSFQNTVVTTENVLNNKIMFMNNCFDEKYHNQIEIALHEYAPTLFEPALDGVNQNQEYQDWKKDLHQKYLYDFERYLHKFAHFITFF